MRNHLYYIQSKELAQRIFCTIQNPAHAHFSFKSNHSVCPFLVFPVFYLSARLLILFFVDLAHFDQIKAHLDQIHRHRNLYRRKTNLPPTRIWKQTFRFLKRLEIQNLSCLLTNRRLRIRPQNGLQNSLHEKLRNQLRKRPNCNQHSRQLR